MIIYYDEWGWIDFLIEVSRTKMFDIPASNLNSIECAKITGAYDVLIYASSERDKGIAFKAAYETKT